MIISILLLAICLAAIFLVAYSCYRKDMHLRDLVLDYACAAVWLVIGTDRLIHLDENGWFMTGSALLIGILFLVKGLGNSKKGKKHDEL